MRLVDDQYFVLGKHGGAFDGVDREQGVVGDDDLGEFGTFAGHLGEALGAVSALRCSQALTGGHGDLRPGAVGDARREVVAVTGLGVLRPVPQPQQVLAQPAGGRGGLELVEEPLLLVLRDALVEAVQTQIVRPALEHRELRAAAQQGCSASTVRGRSRSTSCRCSARVAVATTTRSPCASAGTR